MGLANYSELKTSIAKFMARSGDANITDNADDFITLAEAHINRVIEDLSQDATLNAVADSALIDISSLNIIEPISLWRTDEAGEDTPIELKALGTFAYNDVAGEPYAAAIDGDNLEFNRPLQTGQTFRFVYRGRVALSDSNTTNDILTNHPDVYLAAAVFWGGMFKQDAEMAGAYKALWDEFAHETAHTIAKQKRGTLRPLDGLPQGNQHRGSYQG